MTIRQFGTSLALRSHPENRFTMMAGQKHLLFDRYRLDLHAGRLEGPSGPIALTPKALAVLHYLVARPGRLVTKRALLDAHWPGVFVADGVLKVCIRQIRRALHDDARGPRFIETAHRRGYRFIAPVTPSPAIHETAEPEPFNPATPSDVPPVHYALSGEVNIAYQVLGDGPIDLVFIMGWVTHLEWAWRDPSFAAFLRRLASFSRLILLDKRGTGLSDPAIDMPTLEQRMDDVRAVMDAVHSRRAVLLGVSEGGPLCSLFAATYPERTEGLVMIGTYARRTRSDDYPWGPTQAQREGFCREVLAQWGGPVGIDERAPSKARDPQFRAWWSSYLRLGASPAAAVALTRMNAQIDIRHILPAVNVPTLVLHRTGDRCLRVEEGRYVASLVPGAEFVELPGEDHLPFVGDQRAMLDAIEQFLAGVRQPLENHRRVATVICAWSSEPVKGLSRMPSSMAAEAVRHGGMAAGWHGEREYAVFDGPARAVRCALAVAARGQRSSMPMRIGLHTGECDVRRIVAHDLVGEVAARVAALSRSGEVLVARTVVDLVAGSGLRFRHRGAQELIPGLGTWSVFAVEHDTDVSRLAVTRSIGQAEVA
jgi:pimeloyl-ACP methyl ester carboxylesterase